MPSLRERQVSGTFCFVSCSPNSGLGTSGLNGTCELAFGQGCSGKSRSSGHVPGGEMSTSHDLVQD